MARRSSLNSPTRARVNQQLHLQNRWKYQKGRYILHAGMGYLQEEREGGQLLSFTANPYHVLLDAQRMDAYMKHAFLLNRNHNTNIALMANGFFYRLDGTFGPVLDADRRILVDLDLDLDQTLIQIHYILQPLAFH